MRIRLCLWIWALLVMCGLAHGQALRYEPLVTWVDPPAAAMASWNARVFSLSDGAETSGTRNTRPSLARQRPRSVELLEDAFLRKHPKLLEFNQEKARQLILRRYVRAEGPLRGYMAEAMFVDRNPRWQYVKKPNATQHDVYRWIDGQRPPSGGQIKYHDSGKPQLYASDMIADHRSPQFFIPDDHVEPVKAYLRSQAERSSTLGDTMESRRLWRDYGRVRPIAATSQEIRSGTTEAGQFIAREQYSAYRLLGAASALALAPTLFELANGRSTTNLAAYQAGHSLSLLVVGYGTDQGLKRILGGAMRGGVRGNSITGAALSMTEVFWSMHRYGWRRALYQPAFYEEVVGGVGAIGFSLAAGAVATGYAAGTGPFAPWIGFGVAAIVGTGGYFAGATATHTLLETFAPEMMRARERQRFEDARGTVDLSIRRLQEFN